ncbi:MAG TPA: efflux RND transporter periplasmic adaptor subunit [Polyangiaceae bacterium]|nr:efflux RND transporter periplasmic adaptor subunit [Polyangiaceae bacterium]
MQSVSNGFPREATLRRRWARRALAFLVLATALVVTVRYLRARSARAALDAVELVPARRGDIEDTVTALGKLQPREYVDVGAQVSGQLRRVLVQPGDFVRAGSLLAEIDPRIQSSKIDVDRAQLDELRAELAEQQVVLEFAEQQTERQRRLLHEQLASQEVFDQSRRDARSAAAKVDGIKARMRELESVLKGDQVELGYTRIYAPMSGTVLSVDVRQGQTVNANQQAPLLLRIADLSTMTVWTQVSEADVARLREGMDLYCTTLGRPDRRWKAKLRRLLPAPPRQPGSLLANSGNAPSGASNVILYTALFDLDNPDGELKPEMSAQVFFVIAHAEDTTLLPTTALLHEEGGGATSVYVASIDGTFERRPVRTGVTTRFVVEISDGLAAGERVVKNHELPERRPWLEGLMP